MAISERIRLAFTVIAMIGLAILTWLLIYSLLISPPTATVKVIIADGVFVPETITIPVATTVTWVNLDPTVHTVTTDFGPLDSGYIFCDDTFSYTFTRAGIFNYHCRINPMEIGTVIVQ